MNEEEVVGDVERTLRTLRQMIALHRPDIPLGAPALVYEIDRLRARLAELEDVLRRVEARHGLSVQDFGAVGDGEHDDTDAINRCRDFMVSISAERVLKLKGCTKHDGGD